MQAICAETDRQALSAAIKAEAQRLGFDLVGIAPAVTPTGFHRFLDWLQRGYAGRMDYLPDRQAAYEHPGSILSGARSVVMLAISYHHRPSRETDRQHAPASEAEQTERTGAAERADCRSAARVPAAVSRYANGSRDYHDLIRERLKQLGDFVRQRAAGCRSRGVVDTAPLLERDFARMAGLGWVGKNTMLINKRMGSWLFLAALLLDIELEYDQPHEADHCGTCTRCLDACPTDAFPQPYVLDARKCISYLTIELRGPIPEALREGVGSWLFGCDICQEVCPWNRDAPQSREQAFEPVDDLNPADALSLLEMDETEFRRRFRSTPLWRAKRSGILRNAAIVAGNCGDRRAVPALIGALDDRDPVVRGAAAWALRRLGGRQAREALNRRLKVEHDPDVRAEIRQNGERGAPKR